MNDDLELEVFRAGDYGPKGAWPEEAIERLAADYNPELHEAPVTLDHAQTGPALGWVSGVRRTGDRLLARLRGLNKNLMGMLREGAFKKRSVEIYGRLPETGQPYLKAVSFLGAAAPAVKGLQDPVFADAARAIDFRAGLGEYEAFGFREPNADEGEGERAAERDGEAKSPRPIESAVAAFASVESRLRESGRWIPAWEERGIREFHAALAAIDEIELAEGGAIAPAEWFAEFLAALPAYLPMGESAPAAPRFSESLPAAANLSPTSVELHRRAAALCAARPGMGYAEALLEASR